MRSHLHYLSFSFSVFLHSRLHQLGILSLLTPPAPAGRSDKKGGEIVTVELHGTPNWQRFAETWAALLAAREGQTVVPGSVQVELRKDATKDEEETSA